MGQLHRVLLVEDEPIIQMLIEDILERAGIELADIAETSAKALPLIRAGGFDAAIVDCTLGDGPCEPVIRALAAEQVPFVISSGHSAGEIEERFPGARFVTKPFLDAELETAVQTVLRR
jgi:DNA-binding response OmpR family regulator